MLHLSTLKKSATIVTFGKSESWNVAAEQVTYRSQAQEKVSVETYTGFSQKLTLGLSVGKGLSCQINLTTFIRPWSCQWGHGLISGVSINTHYALKMPNLCIFRTQVNIVNVKVDL